MALVRMRNRIADGEALVLDDSNTTGNKYTHCSWGMCSNDPAQWPDAGDHIFPVDFMDDQRVSPERQDQQPCPVQRDAETGGPHWGCFYRCRLFRPLKGEKRPDRSEVLSLYDERIEAVGAHPEVCACDGTGEVSDPINGRKMLPCPSCRREDYEAWRPSYKPWG
jgi:hypothetical protein